MDEEEVVDKLLNYMSGLRNVNSKLIEYICKRESEIEDLKKENEYEMTHDDSSYQFAKTTRTPPDMVNAPPHYMQGGIETINLIRAVLTPEQFRGYLLGTIIAYRERAPYKGSTEQDYAKAYKYWEWLNTLD